MPAACQLLISTQVWTTSQRQPNRPSHPLIARERFPGSRSQRIRPRKPLHKTGSVNSNSMGLAHRLGDLAFRSRYSNALWLTSQSHPARVMRLAAMVVVSIILLLRSYKLFFRLDAKTVGLGLAFVLLPWLSWPVAAGALVYLIWILLRQPEVNIGHRAGAKGFQGTYCENTLEALAALIERDNGPDGPLGDLYYVEFDVHETADHELVILHDLGSVWHGSKDAPINAAAAAELQRQGIDMSKATVKDLTRAQLQSIQVGGQAGVYVPTLAQWLRICQKLRLKRSLAVEVKSIWSDGARHAFLQLLRDYNVEYCLGLEAVCPARKYAPFGWVAAISFPFFWAPSFGEFGSPMWREWGGRFRDAGVPARCCVLHALDLLRGL